ncbi:hypothetical protein K2173_010346 [Erythroxylum novogranatense]|uniref:Uncharacterized protein n=1 Tax=Erythroxylum novogranatense TaxID=1862640 RepID=A0AAV8TEM6_9ROSI|nr:hypothetical protein K2173_010346 [Erythroxylum novogranatense]
MGGSFPMAVGKHLVCFSSLSLSRYSSLFPPHCLSPFFYHHFSPFPINFSEILTKAWKFCLKNLDTSSIHLTEKYKRKSEPF